MAARRKHRKPSWLMLAVIIAIMLFTNGLTLLILLTDRLVPLILGAWAVSVTAYALRLRSRQSPAQSPRIDANSRYGKPGYRGGQWPREPVSGSVTTLDAVSAYPAAVTQTASAANIATVRQETASGLANLGWSRSDTAGAITRAIHAVSGTDEPVTTQAVIAAVLRDAGNRKAKRVNP